MDAYTRSVFDFLNSTQPGQSFLIEKLTKTQTREQFIQAVKLYIQSYDYGGGIEFTNDYTKIRRMDISPVSFSEMSASKHN